MPPNAIPMRRLAHADIYLPDDHPRVAPGDFWFYITPAGDPWFLRFACPRGKGDSHGACTVPVPPHPKAWAFDGNRDAPTLSPSIHCHNCGFHGFITAGELREV